MEDKRLFVDLKDIPDDLDVSNITKELLTERGIPFREIDIDTKTYIKGNKDLDREEIFKTKDLNTLGFQLLFANQRGVRYFNKGRFSLIIGTLFRKNPKNVHIIDNETHEDVFFGELDNIEDLKAKMNGF